MLNADQKPHTVAVVVPCYRSAKNVASVIERVPMSVDLIFCVNDASDDDLANVLVEVAEKDSRIRVLTHTVNAGVGGAMVTGYKAAIAEGADIIAKLDSDGQMDPTLIPALIAPIVEGEADYVKGNRFFNLESVRAMPRGRLVGNAGLSFINKISSGYWHLFDPTNGFTAIHAEVARVLPLDKLHKRYFFESDMLFRLGTLRAAVTDVPMEAVYGDEISNLREFDALIRFPFLHLRNFFKRISYNYFLRDFSIASLNFVSGFVLVLFGIIFGISAWIASARTGLPATAGTVMLSALPILVGIQLLLNFISHDVSNSRRPALFPHIGRVRLLEANAHSAKAREGEIVLQNRPPVPAETPPQSKRSP